MKFCCTFCENLSEKMYALNPSGGTGRGVQRHLIKLARILGCEEQRGEPAAPRGGDRAESAVRCDHAD